MPLRTRIEFGFHLPKGTIRPATISLRRTAMRVISGERIPPGRVGVIFCDDDFQRSLNLRFRSLPRTTDVLSFASGEVLPDGVLDHGEIYISLPQATRQSIRFEVTLEAELERLLVHGLLHLAGYEHDTSARREAMRSLEERYMTGTDIAKD